MDLSNCIFFDGIHFTVRRNFNMQQDLKSFEDITWSLKPSGTENNRITSLEESHMGDFYIGLNDNATMEIISRLNYQEEVMQQDSFSWHRLQ